MTDSPIESFVIFNEKVYYVDMNSNEQFYALGQTSPYNPGGRVNNIKMLDGYLAVSFTEESEGDYRMILLDKNGKVVYKTVEDVLVAGIHNEQIIFIKK